MAIWFSERLQVAGTWRYLEKEVHSVSSHVSHFRISLPVNILPVYNRLPN